MVAIAIATIILTMAIPSFTETIRSNQLTTQANNLVTALNFARSEAIKRGVQVTVRRLGNTNQVWENGWEVFTDLNGNGTLDDSNATLCEPGEDCLLRTFAALPQGYTLRTGGNYACWVAFRANGVSRGSGSECAGNGLANDTFRLCDSSASINTARSIAINPIGRTRVSMTAGSCT